MKISVFGATGGTGKNIILEALERGHRVTAFLRNPIKLKIQHPALIIIQGNIFDEMEVRKAIKGQDAVVCSLGIRFGQKIPVCSKGTENILKQMEAYNVKRFIAITAVGYGNNNTNLGIMEGFLIHQIIERFDGFQVKDKTLQEEITMKSSSDWTIIRPTGLTNGSRTGIYKTGENLKYTITSTISRKDVAHFTIDCIEKKLYIKEKPSVTY